MVFWSILSFKYRSFANCSVLALVIFELVSLMGENLRGLRENLKHKIRSSETASLAMTLEENCPPALRSALSLWQDGSLYHFATLEETRKPANMATEVFLFSR